MRLFHLFVVLFYPFIFWAQAQKTENLIQAYAQATTDKEAYNVALEIMESNAMLSIEEARKICTPLRKVDDDRSILSLSILADVFYYKNQLDSSFFYYKAAAEEAKYKGRNDQVASNLGNAAYVLTDKGKNIDALNILREALFFSKQSTRKESADIYYGLYNTYAKLHQLDSAIYYLNQTIRIDKKTDNLKGMCSNLATLSELFLTVNEKEKALNKCKECETYATSLQNAYEINRCKAMKARVLSAMGNLKEANKIIESVLQLESQRKDSSRLSSYKTLYARILYSNSNKERAFKEAIEAIEIARKAKKPRQEADALLLLVEMQIQKNQYEESRKFLDQLSTLNSVHQLSMDAKIWKFQADVAKASGDYKQGFYFLERVSKAKSEKDEGLNIALVQINDQLTSYKLEKENALLVAQRKELESQNRFIMLLFLSGLLLLLLISFLFYFWVQTQKRKREISLHETKQLQKSLELKVLNKELSALRAQMNPHFLFNCLSSINDFIMHEDPKTASKYLTKFSHLMRMILNNSKERMISLKRELDALSLYVEMENLRLNDKIFYTVEVDEHIDQEQLLIPSMILQPYIENSIKHGLSPKPKGGAISLHIFDKKTFLHVVIQDDGIGRSEANKRQRVKHKNGKSYGMSITSERLHLINQTMDVEASTEIIDLDNPSGTKVILRIKKSFNPKKHETKIESTHY